MPLESSPSPRLGARISPFLFLPLALGSGCSGGGGAPEATPAPTVVFQGPQLTPTGGVDGRGVVLADVDGDGVPDIFVANQSLANVSLLRGQPGGSFATATAVPAANLVGAALAVDVTGDRVVDLVSASGTTAVASVSAGLGDGTFAAQASFATPWPVAKLVAVDWNRDGRIDLVASSAVSPRMALLSGLGGGTFAVAAEVTMGFVVDDFAVADFDGDGLPDVAAVGLGVAHIEVLRNDGVGGFLPVATTSTTARGGKLVCCDLDRDGLGDLCVLDGDLLSVTVFLGAGSATFDTGVTIGLSVSSVDSLAAGDIDGDGSTDLVAAAGERIITCFGDGSGALGAAEVLREETGSVRSVAVADTRGFGIDDILYVLSGSQLAVLRNPRENVVGLERFGSGSPDCDGTIGMFANGVPSVGNAEFGYVTTNAPPNAVGMFLQGGPANPVGHDPFGAGFLMHLEFDLLVNRLAYTDPLGASLVRDPIPPTPSLAGLPIHAQTIWLAEAAGTCALSPMNIVSSRGLTATIQP